MKSLRILAAAATIAALSAGPALADPVLKVVAAENFYGEVAREIGGDKIDVTTILSQPDADPHHFEVAPSTARAVAHADIVIYNGADYDHWMEKLLSAGDGSGPVTIVAADLAGVEDGANPHVWYKPETLPAVARSLAAELARRDPADAKTYEKNLAMFEAAAAKLQSRIDAIRSAHAGTPVTATEPVFGYMAEALGFEMRNTGFQTAIMNDTEPSPREVAAFEQSIKERQVRILFYNSQVQDSTTERLLGLARDAGVAVIGVSETMPAGETIETWIGGELDSIAQALEATH